MGNGLVKRDLTQRSTKTVVPRVLRAKGKITFADHLWVFWDLYAALVCTFVCIGAIVISITSGDFKLLEVLGGALFSVPLWISVGDRIDIETSSEYKKERRGVKRTYSERKQQCLYERNRKLAPHRSDRKHRYLDVKYTQYSVWADREGGDLVFSILAHGPEGYIRFRHTKKTKKGYAGEYATDAKLRLSQPKLSDVQDTIVKLDEQAQLLEKQSYDQEVEKRELDRLVLLSRRPESSEKVLERHYIEEQNRQSRQAIDRDYQVTD